MRHSLKNGEVWRDIAGNVIHAHGGHMLQWEGYYYWYGEDRTENHYVSCYRSKDLINWELRNHVLTTSSKTQEHRIRTDRKLINSNNGKINMERPKVLYNEKIKKFVLWVHIENGIDYKEAACAIAICDSPEGDYTYLGSFNPYGEMSRDCTLFQDKNKTVYFISAARDNADMHVYRLTEDYLNIECLVHKLWQGEYREAPAVMEKDGIYYMLSSFCTGWAPNQCKYATAKGMEQSFSMLTNLGDETTYHTQPAFILPVRTNNKISYYYVSDRWNGEDYNDSRYVILPIIFNEDGSIRIDYVDEFKGIY